MAIRSHIRNTQLFGNAHFLTTPTRAAAIDFAVILGQSNGNGTTARAGVDGVVWATLMENTSEGGTSTPTVRVRHQGADWASIAAATCGPLYRLMLKMAAESTIVDIIRRSINGAGEVSVRDTQIPGAVSDCAALGRSPSEVELVLLIHGEEDNTSLALAENYRDLALERILRCSEANFPNALHVVWLLRSDTYGADPQPAIVRQAQRDAVARRSSRRLMDSLLPTAMSLTDSVHFDNSATGYDLGVDRSWDAIAS